MKGVKIPILEEESLSISVIRTYNGKVRGYELNSVFYKKGDKDNFLSEVRNKVDSKKFKEIKLEINNNERRLKNRTD
jgi:hypothetical protein